MTARAAALKSAVKAGGGRGGGGDGLRPLGRVFCKDDKSISSDGVRYTMCLRCDVVTWPLMMMMMAMMIPDGKVKGFDYVEADTFESKANRNSKAFEGRITCHRQSRDFPTLENPLLSA